MIEWKQMTMQEAENKMEVLREIFDVVRLLKGSDLQTSGMENKLEGEKNLCQCYAFWNKDKRCENCISVKALNEKKQTSKIEFLDSDMYQVFARYLEIDSEPYVMEMLKKLDENTLTDEEGYEKLTEKLTVYSEKLYKDVLTGAYNRRYFEEKVKNMSLNAGVAVIDLDDFKLFNDTYGHDGGDLVLTTVVNVIRHYIRRTDILVRYGGDEFLLILPGIEKEIFSQKLRMIQEKIHATHIPGFNRLKLSVSIGGAMFTHGRLEEAITKADRLMYMAKGHKNIVVTRWNQKQNTDKMEKRNLPQLLVVDDSEMNREILKEILGKEYRFLEACDGEEALKMLEQQGTEISLVLLDIIMPKMDGFEVLAYMNRDKWIEDIPVIMISSEGSESYIRRAYELGASDYISRPFDTKVVYQRVINMIKLYAKQRRLIHLVKKQQKRIPQITTRLEQIDKVLNKLYEDNALGAIPQDRYEQMSQKYSEEYYTLKAELAELKEQLSAFEDAGGWAHKFLKLIERYAAFTDLTPAILNEFISRIEVHERDKKRAKQAVQHIGIYFSYIGKFENELTQLAEPTEEEIRQMREKIEEAQKEKSRAYHRNYSKEYRAKNLEKRREYERIKAREYRAKRKAQAAALPVS